MKKVDIKWVIVFGEHFIHYNNKIYSDYSIVYSPLNYYYIRNLWSEKNFAYLDDARRKVEEVFIIKLRQEKIKGLLDES